MSYDVPRSKGIGEEISTLSRARGVRAERVLSLRILLANIKSGISAGDSDAIWSAVDAALACELKTRGPL